MTSPAASLPEYFRHSPYDFRGFPLFLGLEHLPSVYLIGMKGSGFFKIGRTKGKVEYRMASLQSGCPHKLYLIDSFHTPTPNKIESFIHKRFGHCRHRGEWFCLSKNDIDEVRSVFKMTGLHVRHVFESIS